MRIGWIGTGVMGKPMCRHIILKYNCTNNLQVCVYNRTPCKTDELLMLGAIFESPENIARTCDVIFMMLGYPEDVKQVALTSEHALLKFMRPGTILVDHTTSSPHIANSLAEFALRQQVISIDAPVSGGDIGAQSGALIVMAGGCTDTDFDKIKPILDCYSHAYTLFGIKAGLGQHAKISNQIMIAGAMIGMCEGLLYASKAGLHLSDLINLIKNGSAGSFSLTSFGPRILQRDFEPGCYLKYFVKDLSIAAEESKRMNLCLPGMAIVEQMYSSLMANDRGECGTQALILTLEELNNMKISKI